MSTSVLLFFVECLCVTPGRALFYVECLCAIPGRVFDRAGMPVLLYASWQCVMLLRGQTEQHRRVTLVQPNECLHDTWDNWVPPVLHSKTDKTGDHTGYQRDP